MKEERATGKETEGGLYIGLMSGTSLDGIDAALMEFTPEGKGRCLGTLEYGWDRDTSERLKALIEEKTATSARRSYSTAGRERALPLRPSHLSAEWA